MQTIPLTVVGIAVCVAPLRGSYEAVCVVVSVGCSSIAKHIAVVVPRVRLAVHRRQAVGDIVCVVCCVTIGGLAQAVAHRVVGVVEVDARVVVRRRQPVERVVDDYVNEGILK
ncbi:MAG: hypothetical protein PVF83_09465 [Anaerolineales bacterium]